MFYLAMTLLVYAYVLWLMLRTLPETAERKKLEAKTVREYQAYALIWPLVLLVWLFSIAVLAVKSLIEAWAEMKR